jgi:hypothetical protein
VGPPGQAGAYAKEEDSIELKREFADGQERSVWNPALSLVIRAFEFSGSELCRLRAAIEACDGDVAPILWIRSR